MFKYVTNAIKQFNELIVGSDEDTTTTTTDSGTTTVNQQDQPPKFPSEWDDLFCFSFDNEYEIIESILTDNPSRINITDNNKSTPFIIATTKGHLESVKVFLKYFNYNINHQNNKGHNALIIASCNGNIEVFNEILKYGTHDLTLVSNNMESSLFYACSNGNLEIATKLLEYCKNHYDESDTKSFVDGFNIHGFSPLHMAVLKGRVDLVQLLLENGADVNAYKKDGSTPLHIAAISGNTWVMELLLKSGGDILKTNRFGSTPLHEACINGKADIVVSILDFNRDLVHLADKDGSTPLHLACNLSCGDISNNIRVIKVLLDYGALVNQKDVGNATPLHIAACVGDKAIELTKLLLANGADPTLENNHGWTPIHHVPVDSETHSQTNQVLIEWFVKNKPEFLTTLDRKKPRAKLNPKNEPAETLKTPEESGKEMFNSIMEKIENGTIKKIVVLTGAGISQNAGIPTYRSSDKDKNFNSKIENDNGGKMFSFSLDAIEKDPFTYCSSLRKFFYPSETGQVEPTRTHQFINNLQKRGVLLRVFTQNVDSLQEQTGLHSDYIVHAHGSLSKWYCSHCNKEYEKDRVWSTIINGTIPYCKDTKCQHIIRPGVIFFGEGLSVEFHRRAITDFRECDCVIVMGTSLTVYPFAGLLNDAPQNVPRILINQEAVGPFRRIQDVIQEQEGEEQDKNTPVVRSNGKRDLLILGDCDLGCDLISNHLKFNQN